MATSSFLLIGSAVFYIASGILGVIGTINMSKEASKELQTAHDDLGRQNNHLIERVDILTSRNAEQTKAITDLVSKNVDLTETNVELAKQLTNATKDIHGNLTGGDSFCELTFYNLDQPILGMIILHHGKYVLYDISARIVDLDIVVPKNASLGDLLKDEPVFNVPVLGPKSSQPLEKDYNTQQATHKSFNVFFNARNGFFNQQIRMVKLNGRWKISTVIKSYDGKRMLYEHHDPEVPADFRAK